MPETRSVVMKDGTVLDVGADVSDEQARQFYEEAMEGEPQEIEEDPEDLVPEEDSTL